MGVSQERPIASRQVFCPRRLERVFADCFLAGFNTRLVGGAREPLYAPATETGECHRLYYREDYFASALHEAAHWCIAGPARRRRVDFGYWYAPDGRSASRQRAFEAVEYRPQAMEWHFARACGYRFRISLDNLDGGDDAIADSAPFKLRVWQQAMYWQSAGLPPRAERFAMALSREFGQVYGEPGFTPAALD
jgi:elongation factor P hydroxylase